LRLREAEPFGQFVNASGESTSLTLLTSLTQRLRLRRWCPLGKLQTTKYQSQKEEAPLGLIVYACGERFFLASVLSVAEKIEEKGGRLPVKRWKVRG
jgi:hypothetical protein